MWIHRLSNIDLESKQADCKNCGRVDIKISKTKAPRCKKHIQELRRRHYKKSREFEIPEVVLNYGKCLICRQEKKLVMDHCHTEKKFRGFICNKCNLIVGIIENNKDILARASRYVKRFKK